MLLEKLQLWLISLLQPLLLLLFRPPKTHKITCYSILFQASSTTRLFGSNDMGEYLRKFTCTRDLEWLNRDDVQLFNVTKTEFIFARITPGVDVYNVSEHPFLMFAQADHVEELGIISADLALDLTMDRKCDISNITLLYNTLRCGTTLLSNMVHKTGQCRVMNEPGPLFDISVQCAKDPTLLSDPHTVAYLRAALLFITQAPPDTKVFVKVHVVDLEAMHLYRQALPGVRELFMYRAIRPWFVSYLSMRINMFSLDSVPSFALYKRCLHYHGLRTWEYMNRLEAAGVDTVAKFMLYHNIRRVAKFISLATTGNEFISYSYDSLMEDPRAFISHLLEQIGVGSEWTDSALTAMKQDSQESNDSVSRKAISAIKKKAKIVLDEVSVEFIQDYAEREHGIKLVGENLEIPDMPNQWNREQ